MVRGHEATWLGCHNVDLYLWGRSYRPTFFQFFLFFFFQEKQEKQEKQETFPKFGNLTEGKIFGTLRIPIVGKKNGKYGHTKQYARKNKSRNKFRREVLR